MPSTPCSTLTLYKSRDNETHERVAQNLRSYVACNVHAGEFVPIPVLHIGGHRCKNPNEDNKPHACEIPSSSSGPGKQPRRKQALQEVQGTFSRQQLAKVERPGRRIVNQDSVRRLFVRSEEHTSELQSHSDLVCRL